MPGPVNIVPVLYSCVWYAHQTREIYQVLLHSVDFKAPGRHVNIWNDRKAKKENNLYVGPVNIFLIFDTAVPVPYNACQIFNTDFKTGY